MQFGEAIDAARGGAKIRRAGWNNVNAFVIYVPGNDAVGLSDGTPYHKALGNQVIRIAAHLDMIYPPMTPAHSALAIPGWLASQTDMLADDWATV